jgi:hypothetical protein
MFNDLSYVIIPFDRTDSAFQSLIERTKLLLRSQGGAIQLFDLVEAMVRLRLDNGLHDLIRTRIQKGQFSRNAYDISICLYFFANNYKLHKNNTDKVLFSKLLRDLKFM